MSEYFVSSSLGLLDHNGDPDRSVGMYYRLTQVGEQVSIVAVELEV